MEFEYGSTIVTLDEPAQFPLGNNVMLSQAKDKSASGVTHVESFEVQTAELTFIFSDMTNDDYLKVLDFFVNEVDGMLNEFYLTDDLGVRRQVRFTTPTLNFDLTSQGETLQWSGQFTVEEIT